MTPPFLLLIGALVCIGACERQAASGGSAPAAGSTPVDSTAVDSGGASTDAMSGGGSSGSGGALGLAHGQAGGTTCASPGLDTDDNCSQPIQPDASTEGSGPRDAGMQDAGGRDTPASDGGTINPPITVRSTGETCRARGTSTLRIFPAASESARQQLHVDSDGNVVLVGTFSGTLTFGNTTLLSVGSASGFVAKLDPSCQVLWARAYGGLLGRVSFTGVTGDAAGNLYISGALTGAVDLGTGPLIQGQSEVESAFLLKLDHAERSQWSVTFEAPTPRGLVQPSVGDMAVDSAGDIVIAGGASSGTDLGIGPIGPAPPVGSSPRDGRRFIAKVTAAGVVAWQHSLPAVSGALSPHVEIASDDSVLLSGGASKGDVELGELTLPPEASDRAYFAKLSSSGAPLWLQTRQALVASVGLVDSHGYRFSPHTIAPDDAVLFADYGPIVSPPPHLDPDLFYPRLSQFDLRTTPPTLQWTIGFPGFPMEGFNRTLATDRDGNALVAGEFEASLESFDAPFSGGVVQDVFVVKVNGVGGTQWAHALGDPEDTDTLGGMDADSSGHVWVAYHSQEMPIISEAGEYRGPSVELVRLAP